MSLIFKKSEIKKHFTTLNKLIYGFPKTGKTTLCSKFKDMDKEPLFITTEDGHGAITAYVQKVTSWSGFAHKLLPYMEKNSEEIRSTFSCIVIDLISELDDMCTDYICQREGVTALSNLEFGKGYKLQKVEFQHYINKLFNILPITFIAHSTEKEITVNGEKVKLQAPSMSKGCLEFINGKVDLIGWIIPKGKKEEFSRLTFMNSTMCIAGSRFPQLNRDFNLHFDDLSKTYDEILNTFNNNEKCKKDNE